MAPTAESSAGGPVATQADHDLAADLARRAGVMLMDLREGRSGQAPGAGVRLGEAGDRRSHELITHALAAEAPGDAVLSEEGAHDPARLTAERVWIVDPLDGTREFGEPGRSDWAVHVALVIGGLPVAGAVALPAQEVVLSTRPAPVVPPSPGGPPRIVVSRSRPPAVATGLAGRLGGELIPLGSAGAKAMAVVQGHADVYVHAGGQYEWDSCAPVAVAESAGLHTSRLDGSELRYNSPDPYLPDLVICRPELADKVLAEISELQGR